MKYTNEKLDLIIEKLKNMPSAKKKNQGCSKQEAIKILKNEIFSMQQRGYSLDEISEVLRAEGVNITTPTLKSYLQRAKANIPEISIKNIGVEFEDKNKSKSIKTFNPKNISDINEI